VDVFFEVFDNGVTQQQKISHLQRRERKEIEDE
jgi:hypothetical protein